MGETPDSTELRMCWCRVGLRSGIPPLSLLSFFGLRFLLCIPTISALLFFPTSTTPANTCNASPPPDRALHLPGPSPRNGNSWFPWPPHRTAPHCIASSSHTQGTGSRAQAHDDGRMGETVRPACLPLSGISPSHHWSGEFDGCCPALIVKPRIGIYVCSHSAASTSDGWRGDLIRGSFPVNLAVEIQHSTAQSCRWG